MVDPSMETSGVVVSKEPDPMDLREAINDAAQLGVNNLSQIDQLPEEHLVRNEVKRLSLWSKMEKGWAQTMHSQDSLALTSDTIHFQGHND